MDGGQIVLVEYEVWEVFDYRFNLYISPVPKNRTDCPYNSAKLFQAMPVNNSEDIANNGLGGLGVGLKNKNILFICTVHKIPCVQEIVTPFYIGSYYVKWGNYFLGTRYC